METRNPAGRARPLSNALCAVGKGFSFTCDAPHIGGKRMNRTETAFLLACLTIILVAMGHAFVGRTGVILAFLLAGATCFSTHWRTAEMVQRCVPVACIRPGSTTRRIDEKRIAF
jgi:hypothetical protein